VLPRDGEGGRVLGFVTAISDGVLSAFIPLLEVLLSGRARGSAASSSGGSSPSWRTSTRSISSATPELEPFYRRFEMILLSSMGIRRRHLLAAE